MCATPARSTARSIDSASLSVFASGFSQNTAFPALAAAIAISACDSPGVLMSTMSMSGRLTTSRQSVAASSQPYSRAAASTFFAVRPQITFMRGCSRGDRKGPTCRYALLCARPMNAYPISATLTVATEDLFCHARLREKRADIAKRDEQEQRAIAGHERQVLGDAAGHRA